MIAITRIVHDVIMLSYFVITCIVYEHHNSYMHWDTNKIMWVQYFESYQHILLRLLDFPTLRSSSHYLPGTSRSSILDQDRSCGKEGQIRTKKG